jgi:hypothetical protein
VSSQTSFPKTPNWQRHEDHVAALYRRLGFTVTQNVNIDGQQVDMICEKWIAGLGFTRLCVECKYTTLDENTSVSKDDVNHFVFNFRSGAEANGWTAGVIVSNRAFSQYARAAAVRHANIHLKTLDELQQEILHIRSYLHESIRRYEESNRFFDFIPPYGSPSDTTQTSGDPGVLLDNIIKNWLKDPSIQQMCLFGDFGTGKTTFLEYLHYTLSQKYLSDSSVRIPLLIPLRRYYEAVDHEEVIKQFFAQECGVSLHYSFFREFLEQGRILLLLDGFDEMGARSDPITRKANYLKLAPLADGAAKVLISCRPAYFLSLEETRSVFAFVNRQIGFSPPIKQGLVSEHLYRAVQGSDLKSAFAQTKTALTGTAYVHIELFDKKQIRAYLKKHESSIAAASKGQIDARTLFNRIREIYDLEDLAKRPILLKLIVSTLPLFHRTPAGIYEIEIGGAIQKIPDITPSILYAVYTEKELEREYKKGKVRWLIDRQDKVRIIAAIAFEMFKSDELAIDKTTVSRVIEKALPGKETEQAYYLTDIRTCSFLNRDFQDSVRFTHKSFMEYYAAVYIRMAMNGISAAQQFLSMRELSDEVALFLGDSIVAAPNDVLVKGWLLDLYEHLLRVPSPSQVCVQNILNVLNYARSPIPLVKKVAIRVLNYRRLELREQDGDDLKIDIVRTTKVKVLKWKMTNSEVKRWEADGSHFGELTATYLEVRSIRFWGTTIENVNFSNVVFNIETWRTSAIRNAICRDSVIINGSGSVGSGWLPLKGSFENCILVGLDFTGDSFYNLRFKKCTFVMCTGDIRPRKDVEMEACRGVLITDGFAGINEWQCEVASCSLKAVRSIQKKPLGNVPSWHELFVTCFEPDVLRSMKSERDIQAKLRQVDLAAQLGTHAGQNVIVSGGTFANEEECRIMKCDVHRITLFSHVSRSDFTLPLAKIAIEQADRLRLRVELNE